MRRGDVVLVSSPFASDTGSKRRPALIVQNDVDNARMANTVVAQITSNLARDGEPTHLRIDIATAEGRRSGLLHDSLASCNNLATIEQARVRRVIGRLSPAMMHRVDDCLRVALGL